MVVHDAVESDTGLGLTLVFALLTLGSAVAMLAAPDQGMRAWGFAAAMVAATFAVVAVQAYA